MSWYTPSGESQGGRPQGEPPPPPPPPSPQAPPPPQYQYGHAPEGYGPPGPSYAGWWKRVAAALIDGIILGVLSSIVQGIAGQQIVRTDPGTNTWSVQFGARGVSATLVVFLLAMAYYMLLEGGPKGQTVGKLALSISLRDAVGGGPIGYGRALGRRLLATVLWWLFVIPGLIDDLWPLWDGRKQTLHDKAVNSVVVNMR